VTKKKETPEQQWKMPPQRRWEKKMGDGLIAMLLLGTIGLAVAMYFMDSLIESFQNYEPPNNRFENYQPPTN